MSLIIKIESNKKQKDFVIVYTDDGENFTVNREILLNSRVSKGDNLTQEKKGNLIFESNKKTAFLKAINYISIKKCSKKMIYDYLIKKDFDDKAISYAIDKLIDYRYVDDDDYAKLYTEYNCKNKGKKKIAFELKNKGITEEIIQKYNNNEQRELNNCIKIAEKFLKNKDFADIKIKQKLTRHLLYKGFEYNTVQQALDNIKCNIEEDNL